ncbi:MAG: hypothetical protein ABEI11_02900 [Haloarculaceae archaeon]
MATETPAAHEADPDRDADDGTWSTVTAALGELALLAVTVGWTAFWLNVVRLHVSADSMVRMDLPNAAFVTATLVVPAVALYLWHLGSLLPVVDVPEPLDGGPIGDATNT